MPKAIKLFETLMLVSMAIALAATAFMYIDMTGQVSPGDRSLIVTIMAGLIVLTLALTFWASRGRSNIPRYILVGLMGLSIYGLTQSLPQLLREDPIIAVIQVGQLALQFFAIRQLFTPEGKAFFGDKVSA